MWAITAVGGRQRAPQSKVAAVQLLAVYGAQLRKILLVDLSGLELADLEGGATDLHTYVAALVSHLCQRLIDQPKQPQQLFWHCSN